MNIYVAEVLFDKVTARIPYKTTLMYILCGDYHINLNTNLVVPWNMISMTWLRRLQGAGASHCNVLKSHGCDWKREVAGCENHVTEVVERTKTEAREKGETKTFVSCSQRSSCCSFHYSNAAARHWIDTAVGERCYTRVCHKCGVIANINLAERTRDDTLKGEIMSKHLINLCLQCRQLRFTCSTRCLRRFPIIQFLDNRVQPDNQIISCTFQYSLSMWTCSCLQCSLSLLIPYLVGSLYRSFSAQTALITSICKQLNWHKPSPVCRAVGEQGSLPSKWPQVREGGGGVIRAEWKGISVSDFWCSNLQAAWEQRIAIFPSPTTIPCSHPGDNSQLH